MTRDDVRAAVLDAQGPLVLEIRRQTVVLVLALLLIGALASARLRVTLPGGFSFSSESYSDVE